MMASVAAVNVTSLRCNDSIQLDDSAVFISNVIDQSLQWTDAAPAAAAAAAADHSSSKPVTALTSSCPLTVTHFHF